MRKRLTNDDNTKELEQYWDEFSQEYEEIQNESLVDIGQQLKEFLVAEKLLPTSQFLDLAGGTGKYIPHFSNLLTAIILLICQQKC